MHRYHLHILILASVIATTPIIADQNIKREYDSSVFLSNSTSKQPLPQKTNTANGIPVAIPTKKGESAEVRMLSGKKSSTSSNSLNLAVQSGDIQKSPMCCLQLELIRMPKINKIRQH